MALAEVGDEQRRLDPTVNALQERVAELLGKEAGLFLPSGSMCNQIGIRLHIRPGGDEFYAHRTSHPLVAEAGGSATLSGALAHPLEGDGGIFTGADLEAAMPDPDDLHQPRARLVCVEQTTNLGGGRIWPREAIDDVLAVAAVTTPAHPPGRRPAAERRGRLRPERRLLRGRVRHRLDRLQQGTGRAGRRLPRRLRAS